MICTPRLGPPGFAATEMVSDVAVGGAGNRSSRDLHAALVASFLGGALPQVDLRAVCLVRAMVIVQWEGVESHGVTVKRFRVHAQSYGWP